MRPAADTMTRRRRKTPKPSQPGRLRIVAGNWRSRLLDIANEPGLRPTSERIRETLFNWLTPYIEGARCLDLYAGTGALGLEALSRGAREAVFVENSAKAVRSLRRNVKSLDASTAIVREQDAFAYLRSARPGQFDIVFLDPPFAADLLPELCRLLDERSIVVGGGKVYIEQDSAQPHPTVPSGWQQLKAKTAGNVRFALYETGDRGVVQ